jgi:hypothetical protein
MVMTLKIKQDVKQSGYFYCSAASQQMAISHFAIYVRDMETCETLGKDG